MQIECQVLRVILHFNGQVIHHGPQSFPRHPKVVQSAARQVSHVNNENSSNCVGNRGGLKVG